MMENHHCMFILISTTNYEAYNSLIVETHVDVFLSILIHHLLTKLYDENIN